MARLDAAQLRAEVELEREWREAELRFLENQGTSLKDTELARYRRALILLVYAHVEGFCKAALATYATHINAAGFLVRDADWAIAAASFAKVFNRLRDNDLKSDVFRGKLPDDSKLHRFCRERDFLAQLHEFEDQRVNIPIEQVVDMESNLNDIVLRKVLYRLGLGTTLVDAWQRELGKLVGFRNNIAHGATREGIREKDYLELRAAAVAVCDGLTLAIFEAAIRGAHLRSRGALPPA